MSSSMQAETVRTPAANGGPATGPEMLIAARALQGIFAAALAPAALTLVALRRKVA